MECKTGYGLEWPDELRLLKLLEQARSRVPIGMSITYCAAHAVPKYSLISSNFDIHTNCSFPSEIEQPMI